jgi:capsular polysaccharide export protein
MQNCIDFNNPALHLRVNTYMALNAQDLIGWEASQIAQRVQVVNQNPAFARIANARSLLFLQGPVGHLFGKLANWLLNRGAKVHRVVFNGGDAWSARSLPKENVFFFDMPMDSWPSTFCRLCSLHSVEVVVLFGQSRPCHSPIISMARKMGLDVVVVEEGYFRPGFATFELGGVNGSSSTLELFSWQSSKNSISELSADVCNLHFLKTCLHASLYYVMLFLRQSRFIHYRHHRDTFFITYAYYWLRSWKVKLQRRAKDHALVNSLINSGMDFFLCLFSMKMMRK